MSMTSNKDLQLRYLLCLLETLLCCLEAYAEPYQTSKMELFTKILKDRENSFSLLATQARVSTLRMLCNSHPQISRTFMLFAPR